MEATLQQTRSKDLGPIHKWPTCGIEVARSAWPLCAYPKVYNKKHAFRANKQKEIWKDCRKRSRKTWQATKQAKGTAATRRGLRAQRVGEATRPGPDVDSRRSSDNQGHVLLLNVPSQASGLINVVPACPVVACQRNRARYARGSPPDAAGKECSKLEGSMPHGSSARWSNAFGPDLLLSTR